MCIRDRGRNGDNGNVATLDLSWQGRLKKLDVRGTGLTRVKPVSYTHLDVYKRQSL